MPGSGDAAARIDPLRLTRERLQLALDASDMGTFDWNVSTGELDWDERLLEIFEYDGTFGRTAEAAFARVHPDDYDRVVTAMERSVAEVGPMRVTLRVRLSSGAARWVEVRGQCLAGPDGAAARMVGVTWDVTAQRETSERERRVAEREAEIATALQRALEMSVPTAGDLAVHASYRPAPDGARIGGDWYDVVDGAEATTLIVGDVVGHDIEAAAAMGQVRGVLRTLAWAGGRTPAQLLTDTEQALRELGIGQVASAVVAQVIPGSGPAPQVRWSCAGHPPPVLVSAGGSLLLERWPADPMLGHGGRAPRSEHAVELAPDATLVLYTDGLVGGGRALDDGLVQLRASLSNHAQDELERLVEAVLADLDPAPGDDDVAIVAARPKAGLR